MRADDSPTERITRTEVLLRLDGRHHFGDSADVFRGRSATPTDDPCSRVDGGPCVLGHVLRPGHVDLAVADGAGQAGVGHGRKGQSSHLGHRLQTLQDDRGAYRAVEADGVCAPGVRRAGRLFDRRPVGGDAVLSNGHVRDHGQVAAAPHRAKRLFQLDQVRERLQHEAVDAPRQQAVHLAAEVVAGLFQRRGAKGLEPDPQRPDRARHRCAPRGGPCGDRRRPLVELLGALVQPVRGQLDGVGAEGVRLYDLGAGADVLFVDLLDQVGVGGVQLVVTDVEEDAARIQHGAHGAVHDVDTLAGEHLPKVSHGRGRGHGWVWMPGGPAGADAGQPCGVSARLGPSQRVALSILIPLRFA